MVKYWARSKAKIRYNLGRKRTYHPDLFVVYHDGSVFIEEVKGHIWDKRAYIKKKLMAEYWCKIKGYKYRVLFEKDIDTVS